MAATENSRVTRPTRPIACVRHNPAYREHPVAVDLSAGPPRPSPELSQKPRPTAPETLPSTRPARRFLRRHRAQPAHLGRKLRPSTRQLPAVGPSNYHQRLSTGVDPLKTAIHLPQPQHHPQSGARSSSTNQTQDSPHPSQGGGGSPASSVVGQMGSEQGKRRGVRANGPFARSSPGCFTGWVIVRAGFVGPSVSAHVSGSRSRSSTARGRAGQVGRLPMFLGLWRVVHSPKNMSGGPPASPKGAIRVTSRHSQRLGTDRPTSGDELVDNSHIMWTDLSRSGVVHRRSGLSTDHVPWSSTVRRDAGPARTPCIHTTHSPYICHCFVLFKESTEQKQGAWMAEDNWLPTKAVGPSPG